MALAPPQGLAAKALSPPRGIHAPAGDALPDDPGSPHEEVCSPCPPRGGTDALSPSAVDWVDAVAFAPLPPPPTLLEAPLPALADAKLEPRKPAAALLEASALAGRKMQLFLAPDQAAQEALTVAADGAGAGWVRRWGGWHVPIGRPVPADSVDGLAAVSTAAGDKGHGPWQLRHNQYSLRVHKCGIGLPCFCQSLLRVVTRSEAIWLGPSKQLSSAAERVRKVGWAKVDANDFHLTLGPREEVRHVLPDMVAALWEAHWVWVLALEDKPGSGQFAFEWASAQPAICM